MPQASFSDNQGCGVGVGSRSRFFKTAGVGVGSRSRFLKLLESESGVGVGFSKPTPTYIFYLLYSKEYLSFT